ncbi:hypothetical protein ACOQNP_15100 [Ectopseudomonas khazarica]|uniref:hypothetical protein n=1 Tax=Ectopseudomonas khazarica TaxID=2502979 RepID=UPI000AFCE974
MKNAISKAWRVSREAGAIQCAYGAKSELELAFKEIQDIGYKKSESIDESEGQLYYLAIELEADAWENGSPFHESIDNFWQGIKSRSKLPEHYYIIKDGINSASTNREKIIDLIDYYLSWKRILSDLKDHKGSEGNDSTLIYFISTDKGAKLYEVNPKKIKLSELESIEIGDASEDALEQLRAAIDLEDSHQKERRDVLRTSLAELLEENVSMHWLISQGKRFHKKYKENYDVYLHKFSANKLLKEIEEKSTEYISKINDSISSSQTKAFAIPGAVIAVAALARNDDIPSLGLVCFALLSVWFLTVTANKIHAEAYEALEEQIKRSLNRYEAMKDENDVRISAESAKNKLLVLIRKSKERLIFINDLALGVLIVGLLYAVFKNEILTEFFKSILTNFFSLIEYVNSQGDAHRWQQVKEILSR